MNANLPPMHIIFINNCLKCCSISLPTFPRRSDFVAPPYLPCCIFLFICGNETKPSDTESDIPVTEIMPPLLHEKLTNHIVPLVWHHRRNRCHGKRHKLSKMKKDILPGTRPQTTIHLQLFNRLWHWHQRCLWVNFIMRYFKQKYLSITSLN